MPTYRPPRHQRATRPPGLTARVRELAQQVFQLWQRPRLAYVPVRSQARLPVANDQPPRDEVIDH